MSESIDRDEVFYHNALRRIYVHIVWLSVAGFALTAWQLGWPWAVGFFLGATVSALNFRWLHGLVDALSPGKPKPKKSFAILLPLRYALFLAAGYVIVKYLRVNVMAALVGLFVAVAAVLLEMIYELIYART
ncbi:MAG: ATP synthase subunit I [Bryobacteraceae bacterium]|nr:ATP synthase subunit I [Bryobacteraceae bacterium]